MSSLIRVVVAEYFGVQPKDVNISGKISRMYDVNQSYVKSNGDCRIAQLFGYKNREMIPIAYSVSVIDLENPEETVKQEPLALHSLDGIEDYSFFVEMLTVSVGGVDLDKKNTQTKITVYETFRSTLDDA